MKRIWRRFLFKIKLKLINKFFIVPLANEFSNEDAFDFGRALALKALKYAEKSGKVGKDLLIIVVERMQQIIKGLGSAIRPR